MSDEAPFSVFGDEVVVEANRENSRKASDLAAKVQAIAEKLDDDDQDKATLSQVGAMLSKAWPLTCPHCGRPVMEY